MFDAACRATNSFVRVAVSKQSELLRVYIRTDEAADRNSTIAHFVLWKIENVNGKK